MPNLQYKVPYGYIIQRRDPDEVVVLLDEPAALYSSHAQGYVQIACVAVHESDVEMV